MRIACAFLCATSRYFMESSGMYETTGNNTRDASWVSVETLSVEYMNQDHFFLNYYYFSSKVNVSSLKFKNPTVLICVTIQLQLSI